jgi:hypothetical protein
MVLNNNRSPNINDYKCQRRSNRYIVSVKEKNIIKKNTKEKHESLDCQNKIQDAIFQ